MIIAGGGLLLGACAAYAAWMQLKSLADTAKISRQQLESMAESVQTSAKANELSVLANIMDIENAMYERRKVLSTISAEAATIAAHPNPNPAAAAEVLRRQNDAAENYLNVVDRLCASVLRGLIPEDQAQRDYRDMLNDVLGSTTFKPFLQVGTRYKNIVHLHSKWSPAG